AVSSRPPALLYGRAVTAVGVNREEKRGKPRNLSPSVAPTAAPRSVPVSDGSPVPLVLRLFGPFELRLHRHPVSCLRSRKGQWLLALLVLRHGRDVERDWLAGTLWPDSPEAAARANLRSSLKELRCALGRV